MTFFSALWTTAAVLGILDVHPWELGMDLWVSKLLKYINGSIFLDQVNRTSSTTLTTPLPPNHKLHTATGPEVGTTEWMPLGKRYLRQRRRRGALERPAVGKGGGMSLDGGNVYPRGTRRSIRDP